MPDWKSPAVLQATTLAFDRVVHALLAIYTYEWLITLDFEWEVLTGKPRFRWPLIFYFAGRYSMLFTLIGLVIATDATTEIDCQALTTFIQIVGNACVGFASINFAIRTMAVWLQNRYINTFLIVVILGHWSLILQGVLVKAMFDGLGCTITWINTHVFAAFTLYTMGFDLLVLSLVAYKLVGCYSRLGRLIFEDGLIYFIIAFLANSLSTIFMLLHLNQAMSIIFSFPSAVASTIVACRVVRRLKSYQNVTDEFCATTSPNLPNSARSNIQFAQGQFSTRRGSTIPGVIHVQMESFTQNSENRIIFCDLEAKALENRTEEDKRRTL